MLDRLLWVDMPGEQLHQIGADGAARAKKWLDATTRVKASWLNTDPAGASKLDFVWPATGRSFSFDIGGVLRGGEFENRMFVAEAKKYSGAADQGTEYRSYLAKCYAARSAAPQLTDHFMWITWHPFSVTTWRNLCTAQEVADAVVSHRDKVFQVGIATEEAVAKVDQSLATEVAEGLWLIVLSDRQEKLVITDKHRSIIFQHEIERGGG